jgi:hypothetical protein
VARSNVFGPLLKGGVVQVQMMSRVIAQCHSTTQPGLNDRLVLLDVRANNEACGTNTTLEQCGEQPIVCDGRGIPRGQLPNPGQVVNGYGQ